MILLHLRSAGSPRALTAIDLGIFRRRIPTLGALGNGAMLQFPAVPTTLSTRSFSAAPRRRRQPRHASRFAPEDTSIKLADGTLTPAESEERLAKEAEELISGSFDPFSPKTAGGEDMPMDEYLQMASLSPWVPVPDVVARRALDISKACSDDVHYELGSGDGRVNFHAIGSPYSVKKTVGIDIDPNMVRMANDRLARWHPRPENVDFICADLLDDGQSEELWDRLGRECTVLTMYFVEEALQKIKPKLEEKLSGTECRIVTVGYKMRGWEPQWDEINLGLPMYMYVLKNQEEEPSLTPEELQKLEMTDGLAAKQIERILKEQDEALPLSMIPQDQLPEPEEPDWFYGPNEREDFHWDFEETEQYDEEGNLIGNDEKNDEGGDRIEEDK